MPEVPPSRLDPDACRVDDTVLEALARGEVGPSFPVAYRRLGDLLAAVHLPATPAEARTESEALELFEALHSGGNSRRRLLVTRRLISPKVLLAAGAITVASATGAAAATGSLPGAAQDTAARVLAKIGIAVPGSDPPSGDHPDDRGEDSTTTTAPVSATVGRGDTISNLATDPSRGSLDDHVGVELEVEVVELDVEVVGGVTQPVTQKTLCFTSAPCEPSAFTVSLTWNPCCGWGSMPAKSSV